MPEKDIPAMLKREGFELVRQKKHRIYRDGEGRTLTTASTPSDRRASRNQLRDLRRLLNPLPAPAAEVDAELPKHEKKRPGASRPANPIDFYEGMAPRSVPATPEATVKALRGYLASRDAYRFKSEFVKEVLRVSMEEYSYGKMLAECLENFNEILVQVDALLDMDDDEKIGAAIESNHQVGLFTAHFQLLSEKLSKQLCPGEKIDIEPHEVWEMVRQQMVRHLGNWKRRLPKLKSEILRLAGRAANRMLRGESASEIRAFIDGQRPVILADFSDLVERIAAEKI